MHKSNLEKRPDMTTAVVTKQNMKKNNIENMVNKANVNRGKGRSVSNKKEFEISKASYLKLNVPWHELIKKSAD